MLIARCARAGPGPATLAHRTRLAHTFNSPSVSLHPGRKRQAQPQQPAGFGLKRPAQPARTVSPKSLSRSKTQTKPEAQPTPPVPIVDPRQDEPLDYVPLLSAPIELRPAKRLLDTLDRAIRDEDLDYAATIFSEINDWFLIDEISHEQWGDISKLFEDQLSRSRAGASIARTIDRDPILYGSLASMAIQAAIRDHWRGLYTLLIALIGAGRPMQVLQAHNRFRDGLSDIQGKIKKHLHSFNRAKRLAARVSSEATKPLATVNIAALSMLNKVDAEHVVPMFGTTDDWREVDDEARLAVGRALRMAPNSKELLEGYYSAIKRFLFAMLIFHPQAFVEQLQGLIARSHRTYLENLYEQILENSIGDGKLLVMMDLESKTFYSSGYAISVPFEVWRTFLVAFQRFAQPEKIRELVEVHLPARGLDPPPKLLAIAVLGLAKIARSRERLEVIEAAEHATEALLREVSRRGLEYTDDMYSAAIEVDYIFKRHEKIWEHYQSLGDKPSGVGPHTRSAFIHVLTSMGRLDEAVKVLRWTYGYKDIVKPESEIPWRRLLLTTTRNQRGIAYHERALRIAFRQKPDDVELGAQAKVLLSVIKLTTGGPAVFTDVKRELLDLVKATKYRAFALWRQVLTGVMGHYSLRHSTTDLEAMMGLRILEEFIKHAAGILTIVRAQRLWTEYNRYITRSKVISKENRRKYSVRALKLLVGPPYNGHSRTMYFTLVEGNLGRRNLFANPGSTDLPPAKDDDVKEAFYWWKRMRDVEVQPMPDGETIEVDHHPVYPYWWSKMVYALVRAGRQDLAVEVVAEAWYAVKVHKTSNFFDTHSVLLGKAGISRSQLDAARRDFASSRVTQRPERQENGEDQQNETLDAIEEALTTDEKEDGPLQDEEDEVDLNKIV